jgi:hypothetical protein
MPSWDVGLKCGQKALSHKCNKINKITKIKQVASNWQMAISLCVLAVLIDPTLKLQEIQDKTYPSFTGKNAGATKS